VEYEIDLRRYAQAVLRRWPLIVACALSAAIIAGGWSLLQPRVYAATSMVLVLVTQTSSQLGTNEPLLDLETIDAGSRRTSLYELARTAAIEAALPPAVLEAVAPENYEPGMLLQQRQIELESQGDLLKITAKAKSPQQAKELADAWAETYVTYVDHVFDDQHSNVRLASEAVLPFKPAGRGVVRNAVLAGIAGTALGVIAALMLELVYRPKPQSRQVEGDRVIRQPTPSR